jgi:nitrogen-specific signal transduction histidine kinase
MYVLANAMVSAVKPFANGASEGQIAWTVRPGYSQPGAQIVVETAADEMIVVVADNGPSIPAALHQKVMQRFYRLEASFTTSGSNCHSAMNMQPILATDISRRTKFSPS